MKTKTMMKIDSIKEFLQKGLRISIFEHPTPDLGLRSFNTRPTTSVFGHLTPDFRINSLSWFLIIVGLFTLIINDSYAQGPNAPEAAAFEPVDASDMVNLLTGDFSYVLPLLNVPSPEGGYPLALSYHAGIAMDQEASWVGLGWSLNPGAINRRLNKVPDDWYKAKMYNILSSGANTNYRGTLSVGYDKIGGSVGLYVNYSEHRAFNGETEYRTDVGLTQSIGIGGSGSPLSVNHSIGTDGINAGVGVGYNINKISLGGNLSLNQSFANGSTTANANVSVSSYGVGFSLDSDNGLGISIAGRSIALNNSNNGSKAFNNSIRTYGIHTPWVNLTLSIQKSWLFERDYTISHGSLYGGDIKQTINEAIFDRKVDYDGYESINPNEAFDQSAQGNFSNVSYDNYSVSGQGIAGSIKPYVFEQNGHIFNKEALLNGTVGEFSSVTGGYPSNISFEKNVDGLPGKDIHFYFENEFSSYLDVDSGNWVTDPLTTTNPEIFDYNTSNNTFQTSLNGDNTYYNSSSRWKKGTYIEVFTNEEINANPNLVLSTVGFNREDSVLIPKKGIGAYKITAVDGKTYHYTIPVYQREQFSKTAHKDVNIDDNFSENQQFEPYATHWLLTAITGPDYIDVNNDNTVSKEDYGYWVAFEYGKWSDGYMWRNPKIGERAFENTKTYSWGIKDIYYLNKIKTRTHTALFIKEDRKDNYGSSIALPSENLNDFKRYEDTHYNSRSVGKDGNTYFNGIYEDQLSSVGILGLGVSYYDVNFNVKKHKTLRLSKVVILKNDSEYSDQSLYNNEESVDKSIGGIKIKTEFLTYDTSGKLISTKHDTVYNRSWKGEFYKNVLDVKDIQVNAPNIYDDAIEVIDFNYDERYPLASLTPNSIAKSKGRLTLSSVSMKGKGGKCLIPPYTFDYHNKSFVFDKNSADPWGYYQNDPAIWSLNEIKIPTGGKITVEYEEDEYKEVVKTNRVFTDKLKFKFVGDTGGNKYVHLSNADDSTDKIDFRKYFETNSDAYVDVLYWRHPPGSSPHRIGDVAKYCNVSQVSEDLVVFNIPNTHYSPVVRRGVNCQKNDWVFYERIEDTYNGWFTKIDENSCGDPRHTSNGTRVRYKFYSNKNSETNKGGGVRVKKLIVSNENNDRYESRYSYANPDTGKNSGTTPYAPADYTKNIPFLTELPAPSVLYQHVKVSKYSNDNIITGATKYKFNTIQSFVSDSNGFVMGDFLSLQKSQNVDKKDISLIVTEGGALENVDVNFTRHRLEDNTSSIGSLIYSKEYNSENQLMSSTENEYGFDDNKQGFVQETFKKIKLHVRSGTKKKYYVNASSKLKKLKILKQTKVTQNNFSFITTYEKYDPFTGKLLEQLQTLKDGTIYKTRSIPAYNKYQLMGNKVDDSNHKNMLSQETANLTQIKEGTIWKTIGANITTWNDNWTYRKHDGTIEPLATGTQKIWRKHKTFTWKGDVDSDGAYIGYTGDFDGFVWGSTQTNPKWINTATVTMYDHYSMPLESIDINNNSVATKTSDDHSKVIAVANAKYTEMYYSGAEYVAAGGNNVYTDGEVKISGNVVAVPDAHTGKHVVRMTGGTAFEVKLPPDPYRIGAKSKFKASVWVRKGQENNLSIVVQNGTNFPIETGFSSNETITAGNWVMLNGYVDLSTSETIVSVSSNGNGATTDMDDFRLLPVSSSMTSYVYNEWDELSYILGTNNLATYYEYDEVGRLIKTSTETVDATGISGGMKLIKDVDYHYKNTSCDEGPTGTEPPLNIVLNVKIVGLTGIITASGYNGSDDYSYRWAVGVPGGPSDNLTFGAWGNTNTLNLVDELCEGIPFIAEIKDNVTGETASKQTFYLGYCNSDGGSGNGEGDGDGNGNIGIQH